MSAIEEFDKRARSDAFQDRLGRSLQFRDESEARASFRYDFLFMKNTELKEICQTGNPEDWQLPIVSHRPTRLAILSLSRRLIHYRGGKMYNRKPIKSPSRL